jgi:hypothetical protein
MRVLEQNMGYIQTDVVARIGEQLRTKYIQGGRIYMIIRQDETMRCYYKNGVSMGDFEIGVYIATLHQLYFRKSMDI